MNETKKTLNLGIIGLSEGNGHPYSWSAICNGYNSELMKKCPFESIPNYLEQQDFPKDQISDAKVTHIWTQSKKISKIIAETCFIDNIVEKYENMIGKVDAILLARDDAEKHYEMSKPFLEAGLPIFIDKPLARTFVEAKKILNSEIYKGQIFTCSALKYAKEFNHNLDDIDIGKIKKIDAKISKDWEKYSIHIIEPLINLIPNRGKLKNYDFKRIGDISSLKLKYENIDDISISTLGKIKVEPEINIIGEKDSIKMVFKDTFFAFKYALNEFINSVNSKNFLNNRDSLLEIISLIEIGIKNE